MSHVDEGTLHAYLDGELSPAEAQGVDAHVAQCAGCRERLDVERALINRTHELLALAAPPDRELQPFRAGDRKPPTRLWWQVRLPLAWAATIVAALGLGTLLERGAAPLARMETPREVDTMRPAPPPKPGTVDLAQREPRAKRDRAAAPSRAEPAAPEPSVTVDGIVRQREEQLAAQPAGAAAAPPRIEARDGAINAKIAMKKALDDEGFLWQRESPISADSARQLLGADPLAVPGLPVRAIYRGRAIGYSGLVLVEQTLDSTTVIEVITGRQSPLQLSEVVVTGAGAAAPRPDTVHPSERGLVGGRAAAADSLAARPRDTATRRALAAPVVPGASTSLLQEVRGPLSADSLASLRRLLRPLRP